MRRPDLTRQQLIDLVTETILAVTRLPITPDQYDRNLMELGLDSLKAIQVVNTLEDRLDLMIDDSNLRRFTTINAIADFFEGLPRA
jgi:acyl carrier protein